jgi:hypothetical protein
MELSNNKRSNLRPIPGVTVDLDGVSTLGEDSAAPGAYPTYRYA